ncbi:glycosyltransferase [Mycolicibacterium wolinskyi]|uniref:Glycosyl transferase family 1 domain-containing protein n=1 Tax=Mycolicibacterium wolinskyi TaxID=59750 RepID=A0A132PVI7_9MYCO|nr:glycosyltransferase [Mycolicibacterium wolinskyi]KWX26177.1 hypothetical protein AFM11_02815 [Mycolicibacterium wolinskyi]
MIRAAVITAGFPDYRRNFLSELRDAFAENGDELVLVGGDVYSDPTVRSAEFAGVVKLRNRHWLGRRILWQPGALRYLDGLDVVVVDLNPRSLTACLVLLISKVKRTRTLVWGHILPRAGASARTVPIRRAMRRFADGVISYTWTDAELVRTEDPGTDVWVASNGLYRASDLGWDPTTPRTDTIYVGRLEPAKKPELLVRAFAHARDRLPADARLRIVGDGSLRGRLEELAGELGIGADVIFPGHVSDLERLREFYSTAVVSASPGYVGLSLTQSLGFGVPMVVADDEPHAPEVELLNDVTGLYFTAGSVESLADKLVEVYTKPEAWDHEAIVRQVQNTYSSSAMADGFQRALRGISQDSQV